jgi:hypothetical protein
MDEKTPIPIDESMPEGLKNAINYLNEKNISLDDKIDLSFVNEVEEDDETDNFDGVVSQADLDDTELVDDGEDEIVEDAIDVSDLNNMF